MNARYAVAAAVIVIAVCAAYITYSVQDEGSRDPGNGLEPPEWDGTEEDDDMRDTIAMEVDGTVFTIALEDNDTARELCQRLPMTITMKELNGNEKYHYTDSLPSDPVRVGTIHAGDVMLWGDDCLVVFYETFTTPYSYTAVGHITDVTGLAEALGSGSVSVTFS